jgi:ATP-dependent DNA ligase
MRPSFRRVGFLIYRVELPRVAEVQNSIAALNVQDAIIDGEIVALDEKGRSSFQLLQGFDMGLARPPIIFYAFDLLRLNGKDLQNLPIEERKAKLEGLLKKPPGVLRYSVSFTKDIKKLLARAQELGLEGEMKRCRWVKPAMVCQVKFTEWTRDDRLRQPVFLGIREDKSPTDVVREKAS